MSTTEPSFPLDHIPDIDYSKHPLYGRTSSEVRLGDRVLSILRYIRVVGYVLGLRLIHLWMRRRRVEEEDAPHLDGLSQDGLVQMRLAPESRADVLAATRVFFDRLEAHRGTIERGHRTYGDGQSDRVRYEAPELFATIERTLEAAGVLASVRAYLGCRAEVRKVTMQINDEWDTYWREHFEKLGVQVPETAFLHVDNTYGVIKVIIYVSEVTESTGPFSYVLGTNRIKFRWIEGLSMRATDIWLDMWPQYRDLLLTLPRSLHKRAKFGDDIPPDSEWGRWLLDHEGVYTSEDGDLLLFDVMGIHRGGMVERGERRILQIMMR